MGNPFEQGASQSENKGGDKKSNSSRGGNKRSTITLKTGLYGTEQFPPDTDCEECYRKAVGVLIMEKRIGNTVKKYGRPLCSTHVDDFKHSNPAEWDNREFRKFTD